MLQIHNSLTGEKAPFHPIEPGKVRMYVCGMTVYDYCHLGHARVLVVFDVVYRYLRHRGYAVHYVRNITDVDDKIIKRANERGIEIAQLTEEFIAAMHEDSAALGVLPPDEEPRATHHIDDMQSMISTLIERGAAYVGENGDVFYDVSSFASYGELSGKRIEDLRAGERVEIGAAKEDPLDFVLWKGAKPEEPAWESPWGPGRPGWHIECSAMSKCCLGNHFDIHGGGQDLQFPHHENEIAQSEAANGEKYVNVWMHNGFVRINDEKMSKSLGNFFTVREVLRSYRPEEVRYFILTSHYRSPLNYGDEQLEGARAALARLYTALRAVAPVSGEAGESLAAEIAEFRQRFTAAMDDDFNTPIALAVLFDIAREINRRNEREADQAAQLAALLIELGGLLGILQEDPADYLQGGSAAGDESGLSAEQIEGLIAERTQARRDRDFARADQIRDELQTAGIQLEDSAGKTLWRRE